MKCSMNRSLLTLTAVLAVGTLSVVASRAQVAAVPASMSFQGRLASPSGNPVPNGTYSIRFSLWNIASGGTVAANEAWNQISGSVQVRNGTFAVNFASLPLAAFNNNLWLEIKVGADAPLTPRQQLLTIPYAFKAGSVSDNAITAASIANGTITGADLANATITADKFAANIFNPLAWLLGGNSATNPASNFLGTTDNQPLVFRTNNAERMRISADGFVGIGRNARVSNQEGFGIQTPNTAGFGGMYVRNSGDNTLPFYGYSRNGGIDGYHYIDNTGEWTLVTGGAIGLRIGQVGDADFNGLNVVSGSYNFVGTNVYGATVFGGDYFGGVEANAVLSHGGTVSGGALNIAGGPTASDSRYATVGGGIGNTANAPAATVSGGTSNTAGVGWYATVAGGYINSATGFWSAILGGANNEATAYYSVAMGQNAKARHNGTFVWANGNTDFSGTDFSSTGANQFLVRAPGGVGIGTNAPTAQLDVNGSIRSRGGDFILNGRGGGFGNSGGAGRALVDTGNGSQVGYGGLVINFFNDYGKVWIDSDLNVTGNISQSSDARYKKEVAPLSDALAAILNLRGVTYRWDEAAFPSKTVSAKRQIGFIAQEIEKVLPDVVSTDAKGYKSVNYIGVVPVLVEAVKTLKKEKDALKAKNAELEARQDALEARLNALEKLLNAQTQK